MPAWTTRCSTNATIILDALLVIRANTAEILDLLREDNGEEEEENT